MDDVGKFKVYRYWLIKPKVASVALMYDDFLHSPYLCLTGISVSSLSVSHQRVKHVTVQLVNDN